MRSLSRSEVLAAVRTSLAYERTLMAWVRTSASLIGFGLTLYKFFEYLGSRPEARPGRILGPREYALLMIGIGNVTLLAATIQHCRARRRMKAAYPGVPGAVSLWLAAMVVAFGILALVVTMLGG